MLLVQIKAAPAFRAFGGPPVVHRLKPRISKVWGTKPCLAWLPSSGHAQPPPQHASLYVASSSPSPYILTYRLLPPGLIFCPSGWNALVPHHPPSFGSLSIPAHPLCLTIAYSQTPVCSLASQVRRALLYGLMASVMLLGLSFRLVAFLLPP